jgi:IPT/TIG domain
MNSGRIPARMMRRIDVSFCLLLLVVVSLYGGCKSVEAPPPPLITNMEFKRDLHNGNGCLEYSWGSEGKRRLIQLSPSRKGGEGQGPMANDASQVQVHALTNGQYSLKEWQFPSGPPYRSPVVGATVELKEIEAVGTVFYEDRSSATDRKALVPMAVKCPAGTGQVLVVDPEITGVEPRTVARNTPVTITVTGSNFTRDSVVLIDGANPTTQYVSASILEAELDADDTARPGKRGVAVHAAKHAMTSNAITLTIE